jgi:hypothetical protein
VSEHPDGKKWIFFTELAEHGLGQYIRKRANRLTTTDKVKLALGVAQGMRYLHSQNPPFACGATLSPITPHTSRRRTLIHTQHNTTQHNTTQHNTTQHNTTQHNTTQHNTDLRLRQVVVMSDKTPKLTKFTTLTPGHEAEMRMKEDVFLFGKLLWALLTERLPYADPRDTFEWWAASERNRPSLEDKRITKLRRGERLQFLIEQCWRQEACTRPSADYVVKELEAILAPSAAQQFLSGRSSLLPQRTGS